MKQKLSDLEAKSSTPVTSAFKRAYSPVRTSNVSRQDQSLSPLSQQLKLAHEEEERLKQEMKKAKLQEIQKEKRTDAGEDYRSFGGSGTAWASR